MKFAVIGKDVSKSSSPEMHSFIAGRLGAEIIYDKISVPENEFCNRVNGLFKEYDGLNFTIPFKLTVIPYLKEIAGDAKAFGAVNTVITDSLIGYNTDGLGFELMLKNNGVDACGKKVLIIGAGGAGRSVAKKLLDGGAEVYIYDRTLSRAKSVAAEFIGVNAVSKIDLTPYYAVINASGVGMHDTVGISPVGAELLASCEVAIDLIYEPETSEFLKIAKGLGKKTVNGQAMLFYQAYYAECIYLDLQPNAEVAKALFEEYTGGNR